jgi:hypothetical protein
MNEFWHSTGPARSWSRTPRHRDGRLTAATPVRDPRFRQVQLAVDQGPALARTYAQNTPSWQFSTRPAVPEYCRCTPADLIPFLRNPVSSTYAEVGISGPMPILELCRGARSVRRTLLALGFGMGSAGAAGRHSSVSG